MACKVAIGPVGSETQSPYAEVAPAIRPAEPAPAAAPVRAVKGPNLPEALTNEYRFLEPLGSNPLMEAWKVQTAAGRTRQMKILYGFHADPKKLQEAIVRLRNLHHPGLCASEVVHVDHGRVVLATDLVKETVRDRYQKCVALKLPGIPRSELIDYLRAAAEVLDYLYQQHGIQHLGLNPRSLVLHQGWLQITDFGLAQLLWLPAGQDVAERNTRYCAPELFKRQPSPTCDQFSLAIIFCELLTAQHPFQSQGNLARERCRDQPVLDSLSPQDAGVIRRALDPDPSNRWPNCTEMLLALEGSLAEDAQEDRFHSLIQSSRKAPNTPLQIDTIPSAPPDIDELIRSILGDAEASMIDPDEISSDTGALSHRFQVNLPVGAARIKLDGFCRQWYGHVIRDDEQGLVIHLTLPTNFWQQWLGRQPGLEIRILLGRVNPAAATPIEVGVHISAFRCSRKRAYDLLDEMGMPLIDSLRKHLLVNSEKRTQDRVAWPYPIRVIPLQSDGVRDDVVECRGKDISRSGIGFYLPNELTTSEVLIELPSTAKKVEIPAMLVRAKPCADGWYEVGALFRVTTLRKSQLEIMLPAMAEPVAKEK